jgi:hypothetical protein
MEPMHTGDAFLSLSGTMSAPYCILEYIFGIADAKGLLNQG